MGDTNHAPDIPVKLKTFVELTMDIASASPRRYFFEVRHNSAYLIFNVDILYVFLQIFFF